MCPAHGGGWPSYVCAPEVSSAGQSSAEKVKVRALEKIRISRQRFVDTQRPPTHTDKNLCQHFLNQNPVDSSTKNKQTGDLLAPTYTQNLLPISRLVRSN